MRVVRVVAVSESGGSYPVAAADGDDGPRRSGRRQHQDRSGRAEAAGQRRDDVRASIGSAPSSRGGGSPG